MKIAHSTFPFQNRKINCLLKLLIFITRLKDDKGVPKIVIVITDGASNDKLQTLTQAKRIKDRGFNIISIGIGKLKEDELIGMASSPNDVYKVDDFDKVLLILSSISRTACLQPAVITEEKEIRSTVEKNTYKYFKFSLEKTPNNMSFNQNVTYLENFTIELEKLNGDTEMFYSFNDENPKSNLDYIQKDPQKEPDMNFVEKNYESKVIEINGENKKYYQVTRPKNQTLLYFGIKGYKEKNEFQIFVYNRTVNSSPSFHKNNYSLLFKTAIFIIFSMFSFFVEPNSL